jgi:hypothetical protein
MKPAGTHRFHSPIGQAAGCIVLWLAGLLALRADDAELQKKIAGVWFAEELSPHMVHAAARHQYFPDGVHIVDVHMSSPGKEEFIRMIGTWEVKDGQFNEETTQSTVKTKPPNLVRRVRSIDGRKMALESRTGMQAELLRSSVPLDLKSRTLRSLNREKFLAQLKEMDMRGFLPVRLPGEKGTAWTLESRMLPKPAK